MAIERVLGRASASAGTDESPEESRAFLRFMARLPVVVRSTFTRDQLAALAHGLSLERAKHLVDYRASIRCVGQAYYLRVLIGPEKRDRSRLQREGQVGIGKVAALLLVTGWLTMAAIAAVAAIALYVLKSLLGIDLLDGPSILHDLFFN